MKDELEPAKEILRSFLSEIEKVKAMRNLISFTDETCSSNFHDKISAFGEAEFNPQSYWEREDAYMWLYVDPWEYRSLMLKPKVNPIQDYYLQPAFPTYLQWRQEPKELFNRKCEQIPVPSEEITLADYLYQLYFIISEQNEHRDVWLESFYSFLKFLRDDTNLDEKGFLENLFPNKPSCKGMEIRKGQKLRRNKNNVEEVSCQHILRRVNARPPFHALQNEMTKRDFNHAFLSLLKEWDYTVITVCIDKLSHQEKYSEWKFEPYHYCLEILLERYLYFLDSMQTVGDAMAESRGGKEDMELKKVYSRIWEMGGHFVSANRFQSCFTSKQLKIKAKTNNISGLQLADLIAHPSRNEILHERGISDKPLAPFAQEIIKILQGKYYVHKGNVYGKKFL